MRFHFCFFSLVGIAVGITTFATGLKICVIIVGIKECKSAIQKKEKKLDEIILSVKTELYQFKF